MADCPECSEPMLIYELDGVETDHCVSCGGTWLDAGELEMVVENAGVDPTPLVVALESAPLRDRTLRRCPRCRRRLRSSRLGPEGGVDLDVCSAGHGLWLDRGELLQIAESFSEGAEGAVASYFTELYPKERRNGWVG